MPTNYAMAEGPAVLESSDSNTAERLIAVIDQGTSSSRVILFSTDTGNIRASHQVPISAIYPLPGWIEMDAIKIYETTLECLNQCVEQLEDIGISVKNIVGLGITNQRETTIVWNKVTGQPLYNAIVWSDARTADEVTEYTKKAPKGIANAFQQKTGLPIHSYFSALKIRWLLDHVTSVAEANRTGHLLAGTVDCWLIWCLTNKGVHLTDVTNASRTLLFNLNTLDWDEELCRFFNVSPRILPKIISSSECAGKVQDPRCKMIGVPICGILGDQQASLVGQTWPSSDPKYSWDRPEAATVKVTYGTGAFVLWNIGKAPFFSKNGILTTVAYKMGPKSETHYALEGAVAFSGATMTWLCSKLNLFKDWKESDELAGELMKKKKPGFPDSCYLVPAFSGLFCPWWQESARAMITGLTADVSRGDLILAGIRSSVYQTYDVLRAATMATSSDNGASLQNPHEIIVDGGMTNSPILMQSLADILDMTVRRHNHSDLMTALGAAVAAALALNINPSGLLNLRNYSHDSDRKKAAFLPHISKHSRQVMLAGWHASVRRSLKWVCDSSLTTTEDTLMKLMDQVMSSDEERLVKKNKDMLTSKKESFGQIWVMICATMLPISTCLGIALGFVIAHFK